MDVLGGVALVLVLVGAGLALRDRWRAPNLPVPPDTARTVAHLEDHELQDDEEVASQQAPLGVRLTGQFLGWVTAWVVLFLSSIAAIWYLAHH